MSGPHASGGKHHEEETGGCGHLGEERCQFGAGMLLGRTRSTLVPRFGVALMLLGLLAGCTGTAAPDPSEASASVPAVSAAWKAQIDEFLAGDPSEFERRALADYWVTDAEYAESHSLFVSCMAEHGQIVEYGDGGSYGVHPAPDNPSQALDEAAELRCRADTTDMVDSLYGAMRANPTGITPSQRIRACYEREGVPDGRDLSDDEFAQFINDPVYHPSTDAGLVCFWDPDHTAGVTVEQARQFEADKQVIVITPGEDGPYTMAP